MTATAITATTHLCALDPERLDLFLRGVDLLVDGLKVVLERVRRSDGLDVARVAVGGIAPAHSHGALGLVARRLDHEAIAGARTGGTRSAATESGLGGIGSRLGSSGGGLGGISLSLQLHLGLAVKASLSKALVVLVALGLVTPGLLGDHLLAVLVALGFLRNAILLLLVLLELLLGAELGEVGLERLADAVQGLGVVHHGSGRRRRALSLGVRALLGLHFKEGGLGNSNRGLGGRLGGLGSGGGLHREGVDVGLSDLEAFSDAVDGLLDLVVDLVLDLLGGAADALDDGIGELVDVLRGLLGVRLLLLHGSDDGGCCVLLGRGCVLLDRGSDQSGCCILLGRGGGRCCVLLGGGGGRRCVLFGRRSRICVCCALLSLHSNRELHDTHDTRAERRTTEDERGETRGRRPRRKRRGRPIETRIAGHGYDLCDGKQVCSKADRATLLPARAGRL